MFRIMVADGGWSLEQIITLVTLVAGLIGSIAALIPTIIKLGKALKTIIKEKNIKKIKALADIAMEAAEKMGGTGEEKKQAVIDSVLASCKELGVEVSEEELKELADYIDEAITWFNGMKKAKPRKARK